MRAASEWFSEYDAFHQNPWNKRIHMFAVPLIMLSIVALLWQVKIPLPGVGWSEWSNAGAPLIVFGLGFYARMRSLAILAVMAVVTAITVGIVLWVDSFGMPLWATLLLWGGLFALCWAAQFVGHGVFEKKKPSFFNDLLFLLVGPAWVFVKLLGIRVPGLKS